MSARNTTSGNTYEEIIKKCLESQAKINNFSMFKGRIVGVAPTGKSHKVDWELISNIDSDVRALVSCKYQAVPGSVDEKLPYEVMKLAHTLKTDIRYKHAWLVMGGIGWSKGLPEFLSNDLVEMIPNISGKITILNTDELICASIKF